MSSDEEVWWCKQLWDRVNDGGVWVVPRTGLMFRKREESKQLVLYDRMPHHPDMEITAEQLSALQDEDVVATRERFAELGIAVIDETVFVS
jgi:hypothetical protein